jgi:hypothetical protein
VKRVMYRCEDGCTTHLRSPILQRGRSSEKGCGQELGRGVVGATEWNYLPVRPQARSLCLTLTAAESSSILVVYLSTSVKKAVRIAQSNNFMGLICSSKLLVRKPCIKFSNIWDA